MKTSGAPLSAIASPVNDIEKVSEHLDQINHAEQAYLAIELQGMSASRPDTT